MFFTMEDEKKIVSILSENERIEGAILLGSAAKGGMRPESDVDIAILFAKGTVMDGLALSELSADLSFSVGRVVDAGILSSRNLIYAREAILHGRRIFERSRFAFDLAAATLLGIYARFNEDRQEVLHAYSA